ARKKKGDSASSTTTPTPTPTTTAESAPRLSAHETHISQQSGSGTGEGTGSKPGVSDVPSDDSEEELSWKSSEDEEVGGQEEGNESNDDSDDGSDKDSEETVKSGAGKDSDEDDDEDDVDDDEEEETAKDDKDTKETGKGDEVPVQALPLNKDNIFQANQCDVFDSDVDEAPTSQTMFMTNLSLVDLIYDEVGPSYDSYIISEVQDHDNYLDNVGDYHKDNALQVVKSNVSSVPNDALMMIINDMHEKAAKCISVNEQNNVVNVSLTSEFAR
nr:hypothetical protein [Tanacetum cinerariifolium]